MSPEDLFLSWLIALPERIDPSVAARQKLDELQRLEAPSVAQEKFLDLLRQVTPFAIAERTQRPCRRGR